MVDVRVKVAASDLKDVDSAQVNNFLNRWGVSCTLNKKKRIACKWLFHASDEAMINVDGSRTDTVGSCGAIIRGCDGLPIAAANGGSSPESILAHEMQGAELGVKSCY